MLIIDRACVFLALQNKNPEQRVLMQAVRPKIILKPISFRMFSGIGPDQNEYMTNFAEGLGYTVLQYATDTARNACIFKVVDFFNKSLSRKIKMVLTSLTMKCYRHIATKFLFWMTYGPTLFW